MPTTSKIVADSISPAGQRLTTMVLEYPRSIHSEFMTHRMFSRNAGSTRAVPPKAMRQRVIDAPFIPNDWRVNQPGMQGYEQLAPELVAKAIEIWERGTREVLVIAEELSELGVHKQTANRWLETPNHIQVVVTATEWDNFYTQRLHPAAQPEIQELAKLMRETMDASTPKLLEVGEWHLPFVSEEEKFAAFIGDNKDKLLKLSVARCARVSYGLNERGWGDIGKDLLLYNMLLNSGHWSPFEHQATPMKTVTADGWIEFDQPGVTSLDKDRVFWSGNFKGWVQNRQLIQSTL